MRNPHIFRKHNPRPVQTREEYTLKALEREFPSGEWVEESPSGDVAESAGEGSAPVEAPSLTIIGGTKYDEGTLIEALLPHANLIVGAGRGVESEIAKWERTTVIPPDPDVYGKSARKVNVEQVLSYDPTSPLLLVGTGERVKQAEAWLKRARWPREVHRIP